MNIGTWILIICILIIFIPFVILFVNFVFPGKVAEYTSRIGSNFKLLDTSIKITEINKSNQEVISVMKHESGDLPSSIKKKLSPEGNIVEGGFCVNDGVNQSVLSIILPETSKELIFHKSSVFKANQKKIGKLIHTFIEPEIQEVIYINYINEENILLISNQISQGFQGTYLWQVNLNTFKRTLLSRKPYYSFEIPPKTFKLKDFDAIIVVYYSENYSFAFAGDSSRPKNSTVRIYSKKYPEGNDIAQFAYKAGTIIDVHVNVKGEIILIGDPSRPTVVKNYQRPARMWKISNYEL